ncbi:MAG: DotA/TraY family protein [Gammaproteobacteria bacterium]|nr:DotA/TraY family protein [Gammaproteobacteria bacterium]
MISLFTIAPNDQSVLYLGHLFGAMGSVLPSETAITLAGSMFKTLNTSALILGAILVVHTTVIGLIKTATEGEFLGKQWSSLWVPLRMVMGISLLFPTTGGYSAIQVVMMWFILQGVGAADAMWNTVLTYTAITGSPYAAVNLPSAGYTQNMKTLFQALSCQESAHQTSEQTYPFGTANLHYFYCGDPAYKDTPFCTTSRDQLIKITEGSSQVIKVPAAGNVPAQLWYNIGPNGNCGAIAYSDPGTSPGSACADTSTPINNLKCETAKAQQAALGKIIRDYSITAWAIALADLDYISFNLNMLPKPVTTPWIINYCKSVNIDQSKCCIFNQAPVQQGLLGITSLCYKSTDNKFPSTTGSVGGIDYTNTSDDAISKVYWPFDDDIQQAIKVNLNNSTDFIGYGVSTYTTKILDVVTTWLTQQMATTKLSDWRATAENQGWILAGAYYYQIAQMNNSVMDAAMPTFIVGGHNPPLEPMFWYRNNFNAVQKIIELSAPQGMSSTPPQVDQAASSLGGATNGLVNAFMKMISGSNTVSGFSTNPIVALQSFGKYMLITGLVAYGVFLVIISVMLVVGKINVLALGTGLTDSPVSNLMAFLASTLNAWFMVLIAFCFSVGGLLAVYTPLIPYVIFTFGAIGWMIAVIEGVVASPFIALGILAPGGQSEMMGHAHPTIMMLMNLFLRPTLMIVGMMMGMLLAPVVVVMINSGFKTVMSTVSGDVPGPIEVIMFLLAYVALILAAINKCFELISWLPNHVLTWIGGQATSYGEGAPLKEMKEAVGAGGAAVAGGMKAANEAAGGAAQAAIKDDVAQTEKDAKAGGGAATKGSDAPPPPPPAAKG